MKAFIYRNFHAKRFFSKIGILLENWLFLKRPKTHISERNRNWKKLKKYDPLLNWKIIGDQLLQLFQISFPFRDMSFLSFLGSKILFQNTDFWEKSFGTEVSMYERFHMTRKTPTSEILPPPLVTHSDHGTNVSDRIVQKTKTVVNTRFFLRIFFPAYFDHWRLT